MTLEKAAEESITTEKIPSLSDLLQFFLNEEFGEGVIGLNKTGPGWNEYAIFLRIPDGDDPHIVTSHNLIGTIEDHNVTIRVASLDEYFNFHRRHEETRNVAHPQFFEWFARTIKNEYYHELRKMGWLNEDGTRNTEFRRPSQCLARDITIR